MRGGGGPPASAADVAACEAAAARGEEIDERPLLALFTEAGAPGVWRFPLFTPAFCTLLLEELEHHEASGIPLRRPNGMNRYGAILDELGLEASLAYLSGGAAGKAGVGGGGLRPSVPVPPSSLPVRAAP